VRKADRPWNGGYCVKGVVAGSHAPLYLTDSKIDSAGMVTAGAVIALLGFAISAAKSKLANAMRKQRKGRRVSQETGQSAK
jgi:hypothetical protein